MRTATKKRNIFDPNYAPYGTFDGEPGDPSQWADAHKQAWDQATCKEIIGEETPWSILGVEIGSAFSVVKSAYRALIRKHHPDLVQDATAKLDANEKCKKIIAAYSVLEESFKGR
jgi:DnaJ-class molecular chaperone